MKGIQRSSNGFSIIEMLSVMFIMALVAAAIGEVCVTENVVAFRTYNKIEALSNARRVASFIERDVHMARFVGDQFATVSVTNPSSTQSNSFPGGGASNPYTSTGTADINISGFNGFPGATPNSTWPAAPYFLDAQTLILQVPIFTTDGFPTLSSNGIGFWNVDTFVYKVLADQSRPGTGQFILQKAVFPGEHGQPNYDPVPPISSSNPQTILTGIIGPVDPTMAPDSVAGTPPPKVFAFFTKKSPLAGNSPSQSIIQDPAPQAADVASINGVITTFEVYSDADSKRTDLVPKTLAFRNEMYVRANYSSP